MTFPAASDEDAKVYIFYSPDGNNWDYTAYTSFTVGHVASTTVQRTVLIDTPEHGYLWPKVQNNSQAKTISNIIMWYTIQSWEEIGAEVLEDALRRALEKQKEEETGPVG